MQPPEKLATLGQIKIEFLRYRIGAEIPRAPQPDGAAASPGFKSVDCNGIAVKDLYKGRTISCHTV